MFIFIIHSCHLMLCNMQLAPGVYILLSRPCKSKKAKLSLCLTNSALCHEGIWGSGCIDRRWKYCNRFDQRVARQQLCKHSPTHNNRWGCVLYVRAEQRWNNGVMQPVSKQWLGKHTSTLVVTSATIETVFSVGSVQSAYKRSVCSDKS
jgi:hypothetical protein